MASNTSPVMAQYFDQLHHALSQCETTLSDQSSGDFLMGATQAVDMIKSCHDAGRKVVFVGNGGSAAITSHMAVDYNKNVGVRALSLNDGPMLTCLGNDYGYDHVFAKQIEFHGEEGDLLIAISSSGQSQNILNAVNSARPRQMKVVTLSGFQAENPLRTMGDVNFYIPSNSYGYVEIAHLTICHALADHLASEMAE